MKIWQIPRRQSPLPTHSPLECWSIPPPRSPLFHARLQKTFSSRDRNPAPLNERGRKLLLLCLSPIPSLPPLLMVQVGGERKERVPEGLLVQRGRRRQKDETCFAKEEANKFIPRLIVVEGGRGRLESTSTFPTFLSFPSSSSKKISCCIFLRREGPSSSLPPPSSQG